MLLLSTCEMNKESTGKFLGNWTLHIEAPHLVNFESASYANRWNGERLNTQESERLMKNTQNL